MHSWRISPSPQKYRDKGKARTDLSDMKSRFHGSHTYGPPGQSVFPSWGQGTMYWDAPTSYFGKTSKVNWCTRWSQSSILLFQSPKKLFILPLSWFLTCRARDSIKSSPSQWDKIPQIQPSFTMDETHLWWKCSREPIHCVLRQAEPIT